MNKFIKSAAGTMALISAITMLTACDEPKESGATNSTEASTKPIETLPPNSDVQNAVDNVSKSENMEDVKVDTKIKWLAWWHIEESSPAAETFKKLYGVPEKKPAGYEDTEDDALFVQTMISNYHDRYTMLSTRISSDDSPDIFPFEIDNYPYSIYRNLFQTIDGVIDLETPEWADYRDDIAKFEWGGKNYCPIMDLNIASVLWYRKSVVDNAGFDDPWELFKKGEWTWDKFMEMCVAFADSDEGKWAVDGWNPENQMLATTGVPLIGLEDGKLVSNLNNPSVEKCMELMHRFDNTQEALRYPRDTLNNWSVSMKEWANGNTLFFEDGTWRYQEEWRAFKKKYKWDDDEINFVPFPRMDGSDKYYHQMKQDSYMLVAGSKNIDGYKAWIYANLIASQDEDVKEAARQQQIDDYNWTEELLDRLDYTKEPGTFEAVFDFKNGIGTDLADSNSQESPVHAMTKLPYMTETTYTQIRAENQGRIEARIKEMNATVS